MNSNSSIPIPFFLKKGIMLTCIPTLTINFLIGAVVNTFGNSKNAFTNTISGTFYYLPRLLFSFPSRYFYAIGLPLYIQPQKKFISHLRIVLPNNLTHRLKFLYQFSKFKRGYHPLRPYQSCNPVFQRIVKFLNLARKMVHILLALKIKDRAGLNFFSIASTQKILFSFFSTT